MNATQEQKDFPQVSFSFRRIPAGMLSLTGRERFHPRRDVAVEAFWLATTPVTNADYERFDPSHRARRAAIAAEDAAPVTNVTYRDAVRYCAWLSEQLGAEVRLPTTLEWEWACLGATDGPYAFGQVPWFASQRKYANVRVGDVVPVGQYPANGYGLYDMAGNVHEICGDPYVTRPDDVRRFPGDPDYDQLLQRANRDLVLAKNCSAASPSIEGCACAHIRFLTRDSQEAALSFRVAVTAF